MTSLSDYFANRTDCRDMCVRMVRSDMCLWSGIAPYDRAWAHFLRLENFQAAWNSPEFQKWWEQPKERRAIPTQEVVFAWPDYIHADQELKIENLDEVIRLLKQFLVLKRGISESLRLTRKKAHLTLQEWYAICDLSQDLLFSLESNGRCILDQADLMLLCQRFNLPANVFCPNPRISSEVDYILKLRNMTEAQLREHIEEKEAISERLWDLRHHLNTSIVSISRALHMSVQRYRDMESGKSDVSYSVARWASEFYKIPLRFFLTDSE